jgi:predicted dehydrogenase
MPNNLIDRILIIGLGSIGKRHLRLARELMPKVDIRVMRHVATNEVSEYANGYFFNIEDSVAFAPQIAVIASPAPFHIAVAQILAEAGAHLLIEKPLSASLSGISQLIDTCQKQRVLLLTGYNLRFFSSLQRYREFLDEGMIGKILSVRCDIGQYLPSWRSDRDYRQCVSARHKLGGGALLELSHELDYLRWIFGEVEWVKATLSRQSKLEIDVEDTAHLTLGFLSTIDGHQLIAAVNLDFIRHDTTRLCVAIGEKGSLRWNGISGVVDFYGVGSGGWQELFRHPEKRDDSYMAEWKNLLESIAEHKTPMITAEDGLKVMEIIEAARQSDISGGARFDLTTLKAKGTDL